MRFHGASCPWMTPGAIAEAEESIAWIRAEVEARGGFRSFEASVGMLQRCPVILPSGRGLSRGGFPQGRD